MPDSRLLRLVHRGPAGDLVQAAPAALAQLTLGLDTAEPDAGRDGAGRRVVAIVPGDLFLEFLFLEAFVIHYAGSMTIRRDPIMQDTSSAVPIGVISDTHGLLRPEALTLLGGCGMILHLGDVGSKNEDAAILERLAELAPLHAVRGNIDTAPWAEALPHTLGLVINGWRLHLVHDIADLDQAIPCDAVLHGHSHKPRNEWQGEQLLFNPGAAGKRRFKLPITLGQLWAGDRGLRGAILHLPL